MSESCTIEERKRIEALKDPLGGLTSNLRDERPDCRRRSTPLITIIVGALALVVVPTARGVKPTRTVLGPGEPFVIPAGLGCSFDVGGEPNEGVKRAITEFSDGRIQTIVQADPTLTNLHTGASFVQRSRYKATETYNAETNDVLVELSGRVFVHLFPGDQGPFGEVGETGALYSVVGHMMATLDLDTELFTSFVLDGQATDLCAVLSG